MSVLVLLILTSLAIATCFLVAFIWAVRSGQYEDTCTPSMRILTDEGARSVSPMTGSKRHNHELAAHAPASSGHDQDKIQPAPSNRGVVPQPGADLNPPV